MELQNCRLSGPLARRDDVGLDFVRRPPIVLIPSENELDVSVVIVSWNTRDILRGCLRSILEQTREVSFEVFVVDNNSRDRIGRDGPNRISRDEVDRKRGEPRLCHRMRSRRAGGLGTIHAIA